MYKTDPGKIKIAFNNARSMHKHFRDVEFEPNVLAADAIGFADTRLCRRDENVHYAQKRLRLLVRKEFHNNTNYEIGYGQPWVII